MAVCIESSPCVCPQLLPALILLPAGPLPSAWSAFTQMAHLDIANDDGLGGSIPPEWASMTEVTYLRLADNSGLTGIIPPEFGSLTKALHVNISDNPNLAGKWNSG